MSFLAFLSTCLIFGIVDFGPLSWVDFELSLRPVAAKAHLDINSRILYKYSDLYQIKSKSKISNSVGFSLPIGPGDPILKLCMATQF